MHPSIRFTIAAILAAPALIGAQQPTGAATPQRVNLVSRVIRASMRGITPSEEERTSLQTVQQKYRPQFQTIAAETKPIRLALRDARQKHDTVAARAARKALQEKRHEGVVLLQAALRDIGTKLSPEHQTQFAANLVRVRILIRRWALG